MDDCFDIIYDALSSYFVFDGSSVKVIWEGNKPLKFYIKIIWEDDTITFEASHKELKKYEEIVYNTFLPFYANKYLFKINKED